MAKVAPEGLITALDIGSSKVSAMIAQKGDGGELIVLGTGQRESRGVKRGYIADMGATEAAIAAAESRMRPILMTAIASLAGFLPLVVATTAGAGSDTTVDSSTGSATSFALTADGQRDPSLDFGFVKPEVSVGDYVIVHTGFALARLDPVEAARTLALLREAGVDVEDAP